MMIKEAESYVKANSFLREELHHKGDPLCPTFSVCIKYDGTSPKNKIKFLQGFSK